eukprot:Nk52_evm74s1444 gene=Nk52_evmTU74s1444
MTHYHAMPPQILDFSCVSAEECSLLNDGAKKGSRAVISAEVRILNNSAVAFYKIRLKIKGSIVSYDEDDEEEDCDSNSSGGSDDSYEDSLNQGFSFRRCISRTSQSSATSSRENVYYVYRRYSDFFKLHQRLGKQLMPHITSSLPSLPAKRILKMKKFDSTFIENRRHGLDEYLTSILEHPVASKNQIVKEFLNDSIWMKPQDEIEAVKNAAYSLGKYLAQYAEDMDDPMRKKSLGLGLDCMRNEHCVGPNCRGSFGAPAVKYGLYKRVNELRDEYDYERAYTTKGTVLEDKKPANSWFYDSFGKYPKEYGVSQEVGTSVTRSVKLPQHRDLESSLRNGMDEVSVTGTDGRVPLGGIGGLLGAGEPVAPASIKANDFDNFENIPGGDVGNITGSSTKNQFNSSVNDKYPSKFILNQRAHFLRDYSRKRFGVRRMQL